MLGRLLRSALLSTILATPLPAWAHGANLGVFEAVGCSKGCSGIQRVETFGKWLGRDVDWVVDYAGGSDWTSLVKTAAEKSKYWGQSRFRFSLAIQMLPKDGSSTLREGALGKYDDYWRRIAQDIVTAGKGDADIRIGWEFNGGWYTWSAAKDPQAFVTYWRHIVAAMRSVRGANFTFDWNPALGKNLIAPDEVYPGDDVVDVIGLDVYNSGPSAMSGEQRWNAYKGQEFGLDWLTQFARRHAKPISIPEWGTGKKTGTKYGGGDDAYFVGQMATWIKSHNVLYAAYFDANPPDFPTRISGGEQGAAAKAYRDAFGASPSTGSKQSGSAVQAQSALYWVPAHKSWNNFEKKFVIQAGTFVKPPWPNAQWVPGRWTTDNAGHKYWYEAHWVNGTKGAVVDQVRKSPN